MTHLPRARRETPPPRNGKLWELRGRAEGGIARGSSVTTAGRRVGVVHVFAEAVAQEAASGRSDRPAAAEAGDAMTKRKDLKARLMADPKFREEYARVDRVAHGYAWIGTNPLSE